MVQLQPNPNSPPAVVPTPAERFRVVVEYAIDADLRYLSHHEELRMLARTLVRACWPVRFSQGFNPLPRLTLPLPRSVGMASSCQLALVELREPRRPAELSASLFAALPAGCALKRVVASASAGVPHARRVTYRIELDARDAGSLGPRIQRMLAMPELTVVRRCGPGHPARPLDIRPYISAILLDGLALRLELRFAQQRTARPSEILGELGLTAEDYSHRIRRVEVDWDMQLSGPGERPVAEERTALGKAEESYHRQRAQEGA